MIRVRYCRKKIPWESDRLGAQIKVLKKFDWGREVDWSLNKEQMGFMALAECIKIRGWFVIVFDPSLIAHSSQMQYGSALGRVLNNLRSAQCGRVVNYREGELGFAHYHRSLRSAQVLEDLWKIQGCPSGILLVPVEMEFLDSGIVQSDHFSGWRESGLGAYEVAMILLTHPIYFKPEGPWFVCVGDHYSSAGVADTDDIPIYGFDISGNLVFPAYRIRNDNRGYHIPFIQLPTE